MVRTKYDSSPLSDSAGSCEGLIRISTGTLPSHMSLRKSVVFADAFIAEPPPLPSPIPGLPIRDGT